MGVSILADDCKAALEKILDFVRIQNRTYEQVDVTDAAMFLEKLLTEEN